MTQSYLTNISTSTLSNQNISSALNVHTYTNTSRVRKVYTRVQCDQIAGNGSYVVYATVQRSGAGSAYEQGARTTVAVPSGVTAQSFITIAILLEATDVLKAYVVGLAGDTTTPDIITDVFEEFVGVGTDGKALISADGQDLSATLSVNTKNIGGQAATLNANNRLQVSLKDILDTALTETAGLIAAGFKQFFNIASPTSTMNVITTVTTTTTATTATNLTNAPTSGDFTATMKTSLNAATPAVTVSDKTGFSLSAAGVQAIWDALTSALVDNINVTISSRLASASITLSGGAVTVGTNNDKTGYTASTVSDKTGYSLAATGLDSITATDPGGVASTFPQMVVQTWRRFFKYSTLTSTQLKTYADNGVTPRTTQPVSDDGTTQTQGNAT